MLSRIHTTKKDSFHEGEFEALDKKIRNGECLSLLFLIPLRATNVPLCKFTGEITSEAALRSAIRGKDVATPSKGGEGSAPAKALEGPSSVALVCFCSKFCMFLFISCDHNHDFTGCKEGWYQISRAIYHQDTKACNQIKWFQQEECICGA